MNGTRLAKVLPLLASVGEVLVLLGAVLWLPHPTWGSPLLTVGTVLFAVGRLLGKRGDWAQAANPSLSITARRLFRQRMLGIVFLLLATVTINHRGGFVLGIFLRPATWLLPFIIFVLLELYTAFRLPAAMKATKE